jgi:hypothetical protein
MIEFINSIQHNDREVNQVVEITFKTLNVKENPKHLSYHDLYDQYEKCQSLWAQCIADAFLDCFSDDAKIIQKAKSLLFGEGEDVKKLFWLAGITYDIDDVESTYRRCSRLFEQGRLNTKTIPSRERLLSVKSACAQKELF